MTTQLQTADQVPAPAFAKLAHPSAQHLLRPAMSTGEFEKHVGRIDARVRSALFHFYQPDRDVALMDLAMTDWIDVLEPFAFGVIEKAFSQHIQTSTRRPTPAEIKSRCFKLVASQKQE